MASRRVEQWPMVARITRALFCFALFFGAATGLATAAHAQPTLSKVFTPSTIGPGSVSTITFTIANGDASPVTGLAFTDVLPAAITIADPANASTSCDLGISGSLSAPDGGGTITLADAQLGAGLSCTVTVDVTASTPGAHTNPAVTLSSSAGSSMSLAVDLTVVTTRPGFSKSFAPSSVPLGDKSTLTFTIDNTANGSGVIDLNFTDNLPTGMVIADPANAATDCNGVIVFPTLTAIPGTSVITLFSVGSMLDPLVAAGSTCTVVVEVTATSGGMLDNVSGELITDLAGAALSSGKASATLDVTVTAIALQKSFTDDPVPPGGTATLDFTITNFDRLFSATGIAFTDDLAATLAGLTFSSLLSSDCGGSVTTVGSTTIDLTGGSLAPEASCTISVSLSVPAGATPAVYTNTTGAITGTIDGSPIVGNMASDDLFVESTPILTKEFLEDGTLLPDPVINAGDDVVIRFTITNPSTTSGATDIAFLDELTDGGPGTGFLPFPVSAVLPGSACGGAIALVSVATDRQGLSLTDGSLAAAPGPGDTCTFDVTVTVPAIVAPGLYTNTTGAPTATIDSATRIGSPASDTLTVIAAPSLSKAFTDDPVAPGGTVTLEFTLTHSTNATTDATGITFTDDLSFLTGLTANLPASPDPPCGAGSTFTGSVGDTFLTLMGGTLIPGGSCTFSVTLDVPIGAAPGTYLNTTSSVGATVEGLAATAAPASDDLNVAGLSFTKEFLGDPVIAGDTVTLRFTIANIHPTDDATISFFSDDLGGMFGALPGLAATGGPTLDTCGGTLSGTTSLLYAGGSVLSGQMCVIEIPVLVPVGAADGTYINTTSVLFADQGGAVIIDPAIDNLTVNSNLLQLTKAFTDDPVAPGDAVTLEFTLTNLDATETASAIGFTDNLGAALTGLTFDSVVSNGCGGTVAGTGTDMITVSGVSLGGGALCTTQLSLTVPGPTAAGLYTNTTSDVTGTITGLAVTGDAASDVLEVIQLLLFSKSFDGPTTATGTATLTFTITNPGTDTATDIDFSDDLDAVITGLVATSLPAAPCGAGSSITGISFLTFSGGELLPAGGMCSFDAEVIVPATATAGTFPNTTSDLFQQGLKVADPATADLVIEPPPTFAKVFAPDSIGVGQTSTLTFTLDNSASALAASDLAFTDSLPAGVVIAATPNASTTCTGGTLTAAAGSGTISYAGGSVAAAASCTVQVDVTATAVGALVNTTGDLGSSSGNSGTATDTLTVNPQPGFAKAFAPNTIIVGDTSILTFTIDNSASTVAAGALTFTDNLPVAIIIETPANVVNTCAGAVTAVAGTSIISLAGGTVAAGATCTVSVDVTGTAAGMQVNTSGDLTSSLGNSGPAIATLDVTLAALGFAKAFNPTLIQPGEVSTLTLTIDNPANVVAVGSLAFTDDLPAGLAIATPANASTTCTGGTLTAPAGGTTVSYSGGSVPAMASCTVLVDVTSAAVGDLLNTTSDLTSDAGTSPPAVATLTVIEMISLTKTFLTDPVLRGGLVEIEFTVGNRGATMLTGITFSDDLDAALSGLQAVGLPLADVCGAGSMVTGTSVITLTGGTLTPDQDCIFTVTVKVPADAALGLYLNTTSAMTALAGGVPVSALPASDDFEVVFLAFEKAFADLSVVGGFTTTLTFTITNPDPVNVVSGITFMDDLDAVLPGLMAVGLPMVDVCGMGSSVDGSGLVTFTNGSLDPAASCSFGITVLVPEAAPMGTVTNVTSVLQAVVDGSPVTGDGAGAAMADLLIELNILQVPTLGAWGALFLVLLLALVAVRRLSLR